MFSAYGLPNTVLPILSGYILDKVGIRTGTVIFTLIAVAGQGIFTAGGYYYSFSLMVLGRLLLGIGSDSMYLSQNFFVADWFINHELTIATAIS